MLPLRSRKAFTLIELLVSIAILTLLMVMFLTVFTSASSSFGFARSTIETFEEVRTASLQIQRELAEAQVRRWETDGELTSTERFRTIGFFVNVFGPNSGDKNIHFVAYDEGLQDVSRMSFLSHFTYFWVEEEAALYRAVTNSKDTPENVRNQLLFGGENAQHPRSEVPTANVQRLTVMTPTYRDPNGQWMNSSFGQLARRLVYDPANDVNQPIMTRVFDFGMEFYDENNNVSVDSWGDPFQLPSRIHLTVGIADRSQVAEFRAKVQNGGLEAEDYDRLRYFTIAVPMRNVNAPMNDYWRP
ncbi:MAG: prepilin-type N-terminal cleavage/methylation domain-containing protein [Opitutales bacterium]|nr:prepilin-type N-terminal cleavage/methylation domain-containing protein [Opitutales bacterium]